MPRKGPAPRRELMPDPVYHSVLVTQLVNKVLSRGKRSLAERIVYDALDVVRGLLSVHPFGTLYIADLDAIERAGDNSAVLRHLRAELPGTTFWVDRGIADHTAPEAWLQADLEVVRGVHQFQGNAAAQLLAGLFLSFHRGSFQRVHRKDPFGDGGDSIR